MVKKLRNSEKQPKHPKDYSRLATIILGLYALVFGFFGILCAKYGDNSVDDRLIWHFMLYFKGYDPETPLKVWDFGGMPLILILIGFFFVYREEISLYGFKHVLYILPLPTLISLIWYWINLNNLSEGLRLQFGTLNGYLTIIIDSLLLFFGAFIGYKIKQYVLFKQGVIFPNRKYLTTSTTMI
ncbi:MAG: hypothetical protein DRO88_01815 [Promethearchaeia archaeon]|nr:MAG: hypothetical protein DRO88_01815 [Candidatus Lokiarchaeia archaeon]